MQEFQCSSGKGDTKIYSAATITQRVSTIKSSLTKAPFIITGGGGEVNSAGSNVNSAGGGILRELAFVFRVSELCI
jgi:hypothetical protein